MRLPKNKGFTIIEVLVSMVILSIGVLGLGLLQITSMQNTQGGYMHSQATILAYDIFDAMRANIPAVTNGNYNLPMAAATPLAVTCIGIAANCSTIQMAAFDLQRWRNLLGSYMPSGTGSISTVPVGTMSTRITVTIQWIDPYTVANGAEQIVITSELPQT